MFVKPKYDGIKKNKINFVGPIVKDQKRRKYNTKNLLVYYKKNS